MEKRREAVAIFVATILTTLMPVFAQPESGIGPAGAGTEPGQNQPPGGPPWQRGGPGANNGAGGEGPPEFLRRRFQGAGANGMPGGGPPAGGPPAGGPPGANTGRQGSLTPEQRRQAMLKRFDTNGDGVLDDNERAKMRQFMQERRAAREAGGGGPGQGPGGFQGSRQWGGPGAGTGQNRPGSSPANPGNN